jgi:hypothetical protein
MWLNCKQVLEIEDYNVIYTGNYNSRSRKNQENNICDIIQGKNWYFTIYKVFSFPINKMLCLLFYVP